MEIMEIGSNNLHPAVLMILIVGIVAFVGVLFRVAEGNSIGDPFTACLSLLGALFIVFGAFMGTDDLFLLVPLVFFVWGHVCYGGGNVGGLSVLVHHGCQRLILVLNRRMR